MWFLLLSSKLPSHQLWNSHIFGTSASFNCVSFRDEPFLPFTHHRLLVSLSEIRTPLITFVFFCTGGSLHHVLILGGLWEAGSLPVNSFIRSPAVSCQGFSLLLVSEGRIGRGQRVGTRSQLLSWCSQSPSSFETWRDIWPYHSSCFCLFICLVFCCFGQFVVFWKGWLCTIKRCLLCFSSFSEVDTFGMESSSYWRKMLTNVDVDKVLLAHLYLVNGLSDLGHICTCCNSREIDNKAN